LSIVSQSILECLSDGALRTFTEIAQYPTLATRTEAAIARSLRKLRQSRYIEKVFLKPEMPNLQRIGGANGSYRITMRGLNLYQSAKERASSKLAIWKAGMFIPLPTELLEDFSGQLKKPDAMVTLYSDRMKVEDLKIFDYEDLAPLITKFIAAVARKNFPSMLIGSMHHDYSSFRSVPPDERRRPIEKERHSRFVTWLEKAHSMKFGIYLEFDGYDWVESVDWEQVRDLAKQKDIEDETIWSTFLRELPQIRDAYQNRKEPEKNEEDEEWVYTQVPLKLPKLTAPDMEELKAAEKEWREDKEVENLFKWYLDNRTETASKASRGVSRVS
jgi:hypothetical protein